MTNIKRNLAVPLTFTALCGFFAGYAVGTQEAGKHYRELIACETDSECEK